MNLNLIRFSPRTRIQYLLAFLVLALFTVAAQPSAAQESVPPKQQAALLVKLLAFYTDLGDEPFTIAVVGAPEIAREFRALIGTKAGKAELAGVSESGAEGSRVLYVGENVRDAIAFTRKNKILSITGTPGYVNEGVTLGLKLENRKPKILLNLSSTKAEDINWNPAILKVASTID